MTSECRDQDMNMKPHKAVSLLLAGLLALLPMLAGAQTLERVRASNALTLGYLPDLAPFSSEESGKPGGYAIDLCLKVVPLRQKGAVLRAEVMDCRRQTGPEACGVNAASGQRLPVHEGGKALVHLQAIPVHALCHVALHWVYRRIH